MLSPSEVCTLMFVSCCLLSAFSICMYGISSTAEDRLLPAAAVQMTSFTASKHCRFVSIKVEFILCVRLYNWQGNAVQQDYIVLKLVLKPSSGGLRSNRVHLGLGGQGGASEGFRHLWNPWVRTLFLMGLVKRGRDDHKFYWHLWTLNKIRF